MLQRRRFVLLLNERIVVLENVRIEAEKKKKAKALMKKRQREEAKIEALALKEKITANGYKKQRALETIQEGPRKVGIL
jgi:hypothetical protein